MSATTVGTAIANATATASNPRHTSNSGDGGVERLLFAAVGGYVYAINTAVSPHSTTPSNSTSNNSSSINGHGRLVWLASARSGSTATVLVAPPPWLLPHAPTAALLVAAGPQLRALAAADGRLLWENGLAGIGSDYTSLSIEPPPPPPPLPVEVAVSSEPAPPEAGTGTASTVAGAGVVYVAANFTVRAVRLSDGADLWEFRPPVLANFSTTPSLLVEDGVLYVAGNGRVYALDAAKGHK
ncbi:hypothetical protein HK405_014108, partial [Cladochytrium tenue]